MSGISHAGNDAWNNVLLSSRRNSGIVGTALTDDRHGQQPPGTRGRRVTARPESTWKQTGGADVRLRRPQDEGLGEVRWLTAIVPCRQQFVRTHNRNWILSVTFNQWSSRRSGVVCSEREERYKRAAAFKTDCSRCKLTVHWKFQLV